MLQIRKKSAKVWLHIDTESSNFILSKFYCKTDGNTFKLVEQGGSQRKEYLYTDIEVYDDTDSGSAEVFASSLSLMQRLEELQYVGFTNDGEVIIANLISSDASNNIVLGTDGKLYSHVDGSTTPPLPSNDGKTYGIKDGAWSEIQSGSSYKGNWNAATNSPTLTNGIGTLGDEYKVSMSGFSLSNVWITGDIIFYDGANWVKKYNRINPLIDFPKHREVVTTPVGIVNNGFYIVTSGTVTDYVYTTLASGFYDNVDNFREIKTAASSGSVASLYDPVNGYIPRKLNYQSGFYYSFRFHEKTPNVNGRFLFGLSYANVSGSMGNTDPSNYVFSGLGVGLDAVDTNYQLFVREKTSDSVVKYDTGFAKGSNDMFDVIFLRFKESDNVIFIIKNNRTGNAFVKEFNYTDEMGRKTVDLNLNNSTSSSSYGIGFSYIKLLTS